MRISVLSIFPEMFESHKASPVLKRAMEKGIVAFDKVDVKEFAGGSFRHFDDSPCGGGPGMIMRITPVMKALDSVRTEKMHTILLSPKGKTYNQKRARELAEMEHICLICGHYEGVDARVEDHVDEQISIGDFILTGGEFAASVIVDSIIRLLPGALRDSATVDESYENGLLEYPQYTKPTDYNGEKVPEILLSGNHGAIDKWRKVQSLVLTRKHRPDLFAAYTMSEEEKKWLDEYDRENGNNGV
ncbi:MAG: tRNA (guanosine(37)-N1)-methyltransferase TrmD [Spirochaetales bacterium]|nr:tRNA (guanosine(37)-N1)-methyltransferase TrmD [Candidatus Physcosoma equi]